MKSLLPIYCGGKTVQHAFVVLLLRGQMLMQGKALFSLGSIAIAPGIALRRALDRRRGPDLLLQLRGQKIYSFRLLRRFRNGRSPLLLRCIIGFAWLIFLGAGREKFLFS